MAKIIQEFIRYFVVFSMTGCASLVSNDRRPAGLEGKDLEQLEVNYSEIQADPNIDYDIKKDGPKILLVDEKLIRNGESGLDNLNADGKLLYNMSKHRQALLENNLYDAGVRPNNPDTNCDEVLNKFLQPRRTPEGTCYFYNYPEKRLSKEDKQFRNQEFIGSKGERLGRNTTMTLDQARAAHEDVMEPNPREVSLKLFTRKNGKAILAALPDKNTGKLEFDENETLKEGVGIINVLSAAWLQAQNHDWFTHGRNKTPDHEQEMGAKAQRDYDPQEFAFFNIPPVGGDADFPRGMMVPRTAPDLTRVGRGYIEDNLNYMPTYKNAVTHWWDASHIYGSDQKTIDVVRTNPATGKKYTNGKIAVDEKNRRLYTHKSGPDAGLPITGFSDNWWVGLELIHTVFALEHNRVAEVIDKAYGDEWRKKYGADVTGDIIFEKARLVNSALIAKIHTTEWTPALLFNKALQVAMNANWYGLKGSYGISFKPLVRNFFRKAFPSVGHAISGAVGESTLSLYGVPFTLTEEFVAVYRMHTLVPENFYVVNNTGKNMQRVPLVETRNQLSGELMSRNSSASLNGIYSMGLNLAGAVTLNNHPTFMQNLHVPRNTDGRPDMSFDLMAVDLVRDRERLVPRYNEFRRQFGLKPIDKFADLFNDKNNPHIQTLNEVYGEDNVEMLDLLVGSLAEETPDLRYPGFAFGNTPFYMFALMASRRLMADPFFSDYYTEDVYTKKGLCWVESANMKSVILRHFPELGPSMEGIKNAFKPWARDKGLDTKAKSKDEDC